MRARAIFLVALGLSLAVGSSAGIIPEAEEHARSNVGLESQLADPETADAALKRVLAGDRPLDLLEPVALRGTDLSARGRAILAIRDLEHVEADGVLEEATTGDHPPLVRAWAASARITRAKDIDSFVPLVSRYAGPIPATARPIELKARTLLDDADTEDLLALMSTTPVLAPAIGPRLLKADPTELVRVMQTAESDPVRRQAAAYLASIGNQSGKDYIAVAEATLDGLRFDRGTDAYPWAGGALYVPGIQWKKDEARELVARLIRWNLLCDSRDDEGERQQVQNNLRSVQLLRAAGFKNQWPDVNGPEVLVEWGRWAGRGKVERLLVNLDLMDSRWADALKQLQ